MLDTALEKSERDMNIRLEGMNEFRHQLESQGATFVTRELFSALQDRLNLLDGKVRDMIPREALRPIIQFQDRFWGVVAGLTIFNALLTALLVMLLRK
jgi:hypothetical protein